MLAQPLANTVSTESPRLHLRSACSALYIRMSPHSQERIPLTYQSRWRDRVIRITAGSDLSERCWRFQSRFGLEPGASRSFYRAKALHSRADSRCTALAFTEQAALV